MPAANIKTSDLTVPDWTGDIFPMEVIDLAGLRPYRDTGNTAFLCGGNAQNEIDYRLLVARAIAASNAYVARIGALQAIGTFTPYHFAYGDLGADKVSMPFTTMGISPVPLSAAQIIMWKNGDLLIEGEEWTYSSTGLTLVTALVSGDVIELVVLSPELARAKTVYVFDGDDGTGTGNRVFDLDDMPQDISGTDLTVFPATASRIWVFLNGVKCYADGDYAISGTGSATIITFVNELSADDKVTFIIWGVD